MILLLSTTVKAQQQLVFANPTNAPYTTLRGDGYLDRVYREAFRQLGYRIKLVRLPAERALRAANEGIIDGDISRIAGLEKKYPALIRVPVRIMEMKFVAFAREPQREPASWQVLKNYSVGYIKGWKIFEDHVPEGTNLVAVRDQMQLFDMFKRDRLQLVLYSQYMGFALARSAKIKDIHPWQPPLASKEMFLYMHEKHAALVPRITTVLQELKDSGFVHRVYHETFADLMVP